MVSDDIMINAADGSVLEGKEAFEAAYRSFFENYSTALLLQYGFLLLIQTATSGCYCGPVKLTPIKKGNLKI